MSDTETLDVSDIIVDLSFNFQHPAPLGCEGVKHLSIPGFPQLTVALDGGSDDVIYSVTDHLPKLCPSAVHDMAAVIERCRESVLPPDSELISFETVLRVPAAKIGSDAQAKGIMASCENRNRHGALWLESVPRGNQRYYVYAFRHEWQTPLDESADDIVSEALEDFDFFLDAAHDPVALHNPDAATALANALHGWHK